MKRFSTVTRFVPIKVGGNYMTQNVLSKDGTVKEFKTRKAVEKFCKENGYIYCEQKYMFYR